MTIVYRTFTEKLGGANVSTFVGKHGDLFYDPETNSLRISDGHTPGGNPILAAGVTYDLSAVEQDILPAENLTYNLGSLEKQWKTLYVGLETIFIDGHPLSVQAGSNFLTLDGTAVGTGYTGSQGVQGYTGSQGPAGGFGGASFNYQFSTSNATSEPALGTANLTDDDFTMAEYLVISATDADSENLTTYLDTIDDSTSGVKGTFKITDRNNINNFSMFAIVGTHTHNDGWFIVPIAYLSGKTTPYGDTADISISFARTGDIGNTGYTGSQGVLGYTGSAGEKGYTGSHGVLGYTGSRGSTGDDGSRGFTGSRGYTGSQGADGTDGSRGYTGSAGAGTVPVTTASTNTATNTSVTIDSLRFHLSSSYIPEVESVGSSQTIIGSGTIGYTGSGGNIYTRAVSVTAASVSTSAFEAITTSPSALATTGDTAIFTITNTTSRNMYRVSFMKTATNQGAVSVETLI